MDLWQLHIFTSVVENKSFSKASEAINLSQPTVSSHIKELEDHFGCRLLDRMGKTTEPTKAGIILFEYAKQILALKDETESAVHDFLGSIKGKISIGGSTIPSAFILPRLVSPFADKFPEITIEMTAGDTMDIVRKIKTGELEIGIVGARMDDPLIRQEKLITDEMKLIIPADHKWAGRKSINAAQLFTERIIAREKGSGTWTSLIESMNEAGLNPAKLNTQIVMGNSMSVIQGILNHIGISILSTIAVQDDIDRGRLAALSVKGLNLTRFFFLTWSAKRTLSPVCSKFMDFARSGL